MLSTVLPSKDDLSRQYQLFDLTLRSPITTRFFKKRLLSSRQSRFLFKFSEMNTQNS